MYVFSLAGDVYFTGARHTLSVLLHRNLMIHQMHEMIFCYKENEQEYNVLLLVSVIVFRQQGRRLVFGAVYFFMRLVSNSIYSVTFYSA